MGSKTKVIYYCDLCENTLPEEELNKCENCGIEVCADCSRVSELQYYKSADGAPMKTSILYCKDCGTNDDAVINELAAKLTSQIGRTSLETSD